MNSVYTIDRYPIGTGERGEITKQLYLCYLDCVKGKLEGRKNWLTAIY